MEDHASGSAPGVIYTVGHSDRDEAALAALFDAWGITHVVDVRAAPWSRRHPWHGRPHLEARARKDGRLYSWLGASLGGLWPEGFSVHRETQAYREGVSRLAEIARHDTVAVLCAERDPAHCHRRFIADDLVRLGFIVKHLIDEDLVLPHQMPLL